MLTVTNVVTSDRNTCTIYEQTSEITLQITSGKIRGRPNNLTKSGKLVDCRLD